MNPKGLSMVMATGAFVAFVCNGAAAPGPAAAATSAGDAASGGLVGKVSISGERPDPKTVKLSADPRCAAMHKDGLEHQPLKGKNGGLADALVYVKAGIGASYAAPAEPVLLDQIGCDYQPHMIVLIAGQRLKIRNSDDTLHNVHPRPALNKEFNIGQPRKGMEVTRTLEKPELMIPTGCDVHPWMRAYISVLTHPFFSVSKQDGSYEISGLPDGEYEVEAVHSQLKSITGRVSVKDGKPSTLDLSFEN